MGQQFPLVYRMSRSGRIFNLSVGIIAVLLSLAGAVYFAFIFDEDATGPLFAVICLLFVLLGIPCIGSALRVRVQVDAETIEARAFVRVRRMKRAHIAGFRFVSANGSRCLRLESATPETASLTLPAYVDYDARMDDWLAGITNYDAHERQVSLEAILADPELYGTNDEKLERLNGARRVARWLFWISLAVTLWGWTYPHPYELAMGAAAVLPWVAVGLAARQAALYRLNPVSNNDMGADLSAAFLLPSGALAIRAMLDIEVFDGWKMFGLSILVTGLCVAALYLLVAEFRRSPRDLVYYSILVVAYGYGAASMANVRLDFSDPQQFAARVIDNPRASDNKSFKLRLSPWGPRAAEEEVSVTREFHERVKRGNTVCVYLWPGALGVRWYETWDCPQDSK